MSQDAQGLNMQGIEQLIQASLRYFDLEGHVSHGIPVK